MLGEFLGGADGGSPAGRVPGRGRLRSRGRPPVRLHVLAAVRHRARAPEPPTPMRVRRGPSAAMGVNGPALRAHGTGRIRSRGRARVAVAAGPSCATPRTG